MSKPDYDHLLRWALTELKVHDEEYRHRTDPGLLKELETLFPAPPPQPPPETRCDRCKTVLVFGGCGNAQSPQPFEFGRKAVRFAVWHGANTEVLEWKANLCDRCLYSLRDWLREQNS